MKIDWVEIPRGEFLMGLSDQQAEELKRQLHWMAPHGYDHILARETPQRKIELRTFYIARFPITTNQFSEFVSESHSEWDLPGDHVPQWANVPVSCVWHYARTFCAWLGARLPTSFEWEKAARDTDGRLYPWGNEWDLTRGNFGQRDHRGYEAGIKSSPVGSYPSGASPYGVQDLIGNGFEWTMTLGLDPPERIISKEGHDQMIAISGTGPDPDTVHPWIHRVTSIKMAGMFPPSMPPYTGFRPVMDEWQRQTWSGFRKEGQ